MTRRRNEWSAACLQHALWHLGLDSLLLDNAWMDLQRRSTLYYYNSKHVEDLSAYSFARRSTRTWRPTGTGTHAWELLMLIMWYEPMHPYAWCTFTLANKVRFNLKFSISPHRSMHCLCVMTGLKHGLEMMWWATTLLRLKHIERRTG